MHTPELLAVARGDQPADLLLCNGRLVNVLSGEIENADVALYGGRIAGIGAGYSAVERIDLQGAFVAPGLIDAHVHIESSLCLPAQFAAAVVPRGVTTVVADPHEIANVAGVGRRPVYGRVQPGYRFAGGADGPPRRYPQRIWRRAARLSPPRIWPCCWRRGRSTGWQN